VLAFGLGINSSGVVVGYEYASDFSAYRAFSSDGGVSTWIPLLSGGSNNTATGINNAGVIVGISLADAGVETAFRYASGTVSGLGTLAGGDSSRANAINTLGAIAGRSNTTTGGNPHPALFYGSWVDLGLASGYQSGEASAISSDGRAAGTLNAASAGSVAFLWTSGGGIITLGALAPGGNSSASGVNAAGDVVGTSDGTAFLYQSADLQQLLDLNTLIPASGWVLTSANAINDQGQIVGTGTLNGEQRAFLLNPVPEPSAGLLVCSGSLGLYLIRRRRSQA